MISVDFNTLLPTHHQTILALWQAFYQHTLIVHDIKEFTTRWSLSDWLTHKQHWQALQKQPFDDKDWTDWLIALFNHLYNHNHADNTATLLVRGNNEPEYFASKHGRPARIEFAHGYLASSLHEISHWCIAGKKRRQLDDFGYWYCPDGRDADTQKLFEQVEIKPQAIECLMLLALGRFFYVSQDNLNANFDTSSSTFAHDVLMQAQQFLQNPMSLPRDARRLIWLFLHFRDF